MLSSTTVRATVQGSGSAGPFSFLFRIFAATDLDVRKTSALGVVTPLSYPTDYTVTGIGDAAGGTLTLSVALAVGETLSVLRSVPNTQPTSFRALGTFFPASHEDEFDRVTMLVQQNSDAIKRSARLAASIDPANITMELTPATGKVLGWASATQLTNVTLDASAVALPGQSRTVTTLSAYLANNAEFNVKDYGAIGNGATDDRAALAVADAAAVAAGGSLVFTPGSYKVSSNITLASPLTFKGGVLLPDTGIVVTANGDIRAPKAVQIIGGLGTVVIGQPSQRKAPVVYARWFGNGDIGVAVNAAIASLTFAGQKGPGTIIIDGGGSSFATAIDAQDTRGIRITSEAGSLNTMTNWGPSIVWSGGAGSGSAVKAGGSLGFEFDHIDLRYSNAAYNGKLLSLESTGHAFNTTGTHLHHGYIGGDAGITSAAMLVALDTTLALAITHMSFDYAAIGIGCTAGSNNGVRFGEGVYFNAHFTDCQIKGWGSAWKLDSVVAESSTGPAAALVTFFKLAGLVNGLHFDNVMCVDGGSGGGTLIDLTASQCRGLKVTGGNYTTNGSGTFLRCSDTAGDTAGVDISGAYVAGLVTGVHLGRSDSAVVKGNYLSATTPWTGTEPTRYQVASNQYNGHSTSGVPVANNASIPITPPGSASDGRGRIFIWSTEDGVAAEYELRGGAGLAVECSDPSGTFTPTVGTAASINIYWDAGTSSYRLENKRGGTRTVHITSLIGT